jgi:hypothetical protein
MDIFSAPKSRFARAPQRSEQNAARRSFTGNSAVTRGRRASAVASTIAVGLLLAACGSNSPSIAHLAPGAKKHGKPASRGPAAGGPAGSASSPGGGSGAPQLHASIKMDGVSGENAIKFAACVRSHGVPNFPDPNAQGVFSLSGPINTPQFQRAQRTCATLLHIGGGPPSPARQAQALAHLLRYSQCMRSHGVTSFPDPTSSPGGGVGLTLKSGDGVDPNSAIFQRAQKACASLAPGGGP